MALLYSADYIEPGAAETAHDEAAAAYVPSRGRAARGSRRTPRIRGSRAAAAPHAAQLVEEVAAVVQGVLGAAVPQDQPLMEAGLDSLGGLPDVSDTACSYIAVA